MQHTGEYTCGIYMGVTDLCMQITRAIYTSVILQFGVFVRPSSEPCHYNVTHSFSNLKVTFRVLLKTCIVFIKGCRI